MQKHLARLSQSEIGVSVLRNLNQSCCRQGGEGGFLEAPSAWHATISLKHTRHQSRLCPVFWQSGCLGCFISWNEWSREYLLFPLGIWLMREHNLVVSVSLTSSVHHRVVYYFQTNRSVNIDQSKLLVRSAKIQWVLYGKSCSKIKLFFFLWRLGGGGLGVDVDMDSTHRK